MTQQSGVGQEGGGRENGRVLEDPNYFEPVATTEVETPGGQATETQTTAEAPTEDPAITAAVERALAQREEQFRQRRMELAQRESATDRRINVGFESRGLRVTASMMLAFNHGKTPQIAWEDDASVVRLHTLFYPAIPPEERKGKDYQSLFKENKQVKEAMLARLVEYATLYRELPADIPGTARLRQELRAEAVGEELYEWLTLVLEKTGRHVDRVSAKELWDEAQKACDSTGDLAFDRSKKAFTQAVRKVFTVIAPRRGRIGGSDPMQVWFGLRWKDLSHATQSALEEGEEQ